MFAFIPYSIFYPSFHLSLHELILFQFILFYLIYLCKSGLLNGILLILDTTLPVQFSPPLAQNPSPNQ